MKIKPEQVIYLPLAEAITLHAKENWERDNKAGLLLDEEKVYTPTTQREYEEEAKDVLSREGEGYWPDYPEHHHIFVKKEK